MVKKIKTVDGIKWLSNTKKMPSGSPKSIRVVTSGVNSGTVMFWNRTTKKFKDEHKAEAYAKKYAKEKL